MTDGGPRDLEPGGPGGVGEPGGVGRVGEDEVLLSWLRQAAQEADPVPEQVRVLARAAFAVRALDDELAVLALDTAEPGQELVGVRGDDGVRLLSFEASELGLELQVTSRRERRQLIGQVVGRLTGPVVLERDHEALSVDPDGSGIFTLDDLPAGRARLRLTRPGGTVVSTPWIVL